MNDKNRVKKVFRAFGILISVWLLFVQPAFASVHTYPEGEGRVMWRSLQTLRDTRDRAWQTVLYKRVQDTEIQAIHLRLVGFPGAVAVDRGEPLAISTGVGQVWSAPDAIATSALATNPGANVGEYDVRNVISQLKGDIPLRLQVSLSKKQKSELVIPPFVVHEWRQVASQ